MYVFQASGYLGLLSTSEVCLVTDVVLTSVDL